MQLTDAERLILDAQETQIRILRCILGRLAAPSVAEEKPEQVKALEMAILVHSQGILDRIKEAKA